MSGRGAERRERGGRRHSRLRMVEEDQTGGVRSTLDGSQGSAEEAGGRTWPMQLQLGS